MRYVWDQQEAYFGSDRWPLGALRRLVLTALRRWDVATAGRVDRYLANSRFVARRIRDYYGRAAEVVPPPVDTEFFTPPPGPAPRKHVLVVAALAPYKRVDVAIAACARLDLPLVVVGEGPERERLGRLAGPEVRFAGRVSAEELRDLYRGARLYLQPGVEDFGIATVEAMACGTPVVALAEGGVLDIVRDGREGILCADPGFEALAAAIDKSASMQFNSLNIRSRAERFSPERFARTFEERVNSDWPGAEGNLA
jgi:glycosyltransferase involved in cell wall biosynthesis